MKKLGSAYSFYGEVEYQCKDIHLLKLDPVEVAGCLDTKMLHSDCLEERIQFSTTALNVVTSPEHFERLTLLPNTASKRSKMVTTPSKWSDHFIALISFSLMQIVTAGMCLMYATYFAVLKADETARSIFNGKELSRVFYRTPPPVLLPDFADILRVLCNTFHNCARLFLLSGDWRHWFHQMRLHPLIAQHFGLTIVMDGVRCFLNWTCLPMGWSWSPWIAQGVGYAIIILTLRRMSLVIPEHILSSESPPPYILIRRGSSILFACLWYDNVLVVTNDGNWRTSFYNEFTKTCNTYHAHIKHWDHYGGDNFLIKSIVEEEPEAPHLPIYLGVQFALQLNRRKATREDARPRGNVVTLHWRPDPSKKAKWQTMIALGRSQAREGPVSPREVVTIIGRIIWEQHTSLRPLLLIENIIEITRVCALKAREGWDVRKTSLRKAMWRVCQHADQVVQNFGQWRTLPTLHPAAYVVAASDSSSSRGGYIIWNSDREITTVMSIPWQDDQLKMHIFLKELLAATLLIERLCQLLSETVLRIGIDNSAAAWCLRRLFSTTHHGQELIWRVYRALNASRNVLDVIQLASLDNPADVPTRPKSTGSSLAEREQRFWSVMEGKRTSHAKPNMNISDVRHEEKEENDGFDSDADANDEDPNDEFWEILSMADNAEVA